MGRANLVAHGFGGRSVAEPGWVWSLTALPTGEIAVGGAFWSPDLNFAVLRDGASDRAGTGINATVRAFAVLRSGDLVAGGSFTTIGGSSASRIARWNGRSWTPIGPGLASRRGAPAHVYAVVEMPNGDIVAGGLFDLAGGRSANSIARWDGAQWRPMGSGMLSSTDARALVSELAVLPDGSLVAGGSFSLADGRRADGIARWDGTAWSPLGPGFGDGNGASVSALAVLPGGDLVVGASFGIDGTDATRVLRWSGSRWSVLGEPKIGQNLAGIIFALAALPNGELIVGGDFTSIGGVEAVGVARWNGRSWSTLGAGLRPNSVVYTLAALPNGGLIAGGDLRAVGVPSRGIAAWNGQAWLPLGTGLQDRRYADSMSRVLAAATLPSGEVVAGGDFTMAGGQTSVNFARYSPTGRPTIAGSDRSRAVPAGRRLVLWAAPAAGYAVTSVQWRRNGVPLREGPGGASIGGGIVAGATGTFGSDPARVVSRLSIFNVQPSDAGDFTAVFTNACGAVTTQPATVTVGAPTGACCNGSTCSVRTQAACAGASVRFVGAGAACNAPGNATRPCCRADFDQDGTFTPADVVAFINAYSSTPLENAARADFDGDGGVGPDDFYAFLNACFAGC
jgi:hypothetical protein